MVNRGLASDMSLLSLSELGDNPGAKQAVRSCVLALLRFLMSCHEASSQGCGWIQRSGRRAVVSVRSSLPVQVHRTHPASIHHPLNPHENQTNQHRSGSAWGAASGPGWARRVGGA